MYFVAETLDGVHVTDVDPTSEGLANYDVIVFEDEDVEPWDELYGKIIQALKQFIAKSK